MIDCQIKGQAIPLVFGSTKILLDKHAGTLVLGRIFSGVLKEKTTVRLLNSKETKKMQNIYLFMGEDKKRVSEAPAGNTVAISGLGEIIPGETIVSTDQKNMLPFEDIHFQLVDLPPVSGDFMQPWLVATMQPSDAALLVIDVNDPDCVEQIPALMARLEEKKIYLHERWPGLAGEAERSGETSDPFRIDLPTLLIANKCDLDPDPGEVEVLEELLGLQFPALSVSAQAGTGLENLGPFLFEALEIVRVYTKSPGKPPDRDKPFTVRRGDTVLDVARLVHREIADGLKFARIWGRNVYDGQQTGPDHRVEDGDVVELHL